MRERAVRSPGLVAWSLLATFGATAAAAGQPPLPRAAEGWTVERVIEAPAIVFPTAVVAAPDGTVYLGQDPMDMPGPPTSPIDSVVAIKGDKVTLFADKLWAVMGLEWVDGTLFVVHAPYLSALRDTDGDGKADQRVDLMTGLGPKLPGFDGLNDHVASGVRLGMDGFLYIAVGDKGIPKGVARDGTTIELSGGGVIRIRPDGTGLEVVSTGESNPRSVALGATDEIFTFGTGDDSKQWPNSLTHHIGGGHHGYPYQFLDRPDRCLPVMAGQVEGAGAQGICYNDDGLPPSYRGNLFFCDWGLQAVFRYTIERHLGTFRVTARTPLVTRGDLADFHPFALAVGPDGASFYLSDWAFSGWRADGPKTGRLFRVRYVGPDRPQPAARPPLDDPAPLLGKGLDHPALSARLAAQRALAGLGGREVTPLAEKLRTGAHVDGRLHALWALDAIGSPGARDAIRQALGDREAEVRLQAARSCGMRHDRAARPALEPMLADRAPAIRREAAIALGKIGDKAAAPALLAALGEPDPFVAWSVRHALRTLGAWEVDALTAALLDERRRDDALKLTDEAWAVPVVEALNRALERTRSAEVRARIVANLGGLYRTYPPWSGRWFGTNPLAGPSPQKTQAWNPDGMARVQQGLTTALGDASHVVRIEAIAGLVVVGRPAAAALRSALATETDPRNLVALAGGLGVLGDFLSAPELSALVQESGRPESVRAAALDALGRLRGPNALNARLTLVYDEKAPAWLIARALPSLGREGILPPNDLAGFLIHTKASIRTAALLALTSRKEVPGEVRAAILARLDDPYIEVRQAAMQAVAALRLREAVPMLLSAAQKDATRVEATLALAAMPEAQALPIYLAALRDRSPELRRAGESALLAILDAVRADLEKEARSGRYTGPSAEALERVLTRFRPVTEWTVIGPFPRTTARLFLGAPSIDLAMTHVGAEGRTVAWTPRRGDAATGRVALDDLKGAPGDTSRSGYDAGTSPDLAAFAFAEVVSDRDRPARLLVGSSGAVVVTINEEPVHDSRSLAGRPYAPDSDLVACTLKAGKNRVLIQTRQGIGAWAFSVQVSEPSNLAIATGKGRTTDPEALRAFALSHAGDPRSGEALFFDAGGLGCARCHSAGGRGTSTIGPDLSGLALRFDRAGIVRSVLEPSSRLATGYQPVVVATRDAKVLTGLIRTETDAFLELVDSEAKPTRVALADIVERRRADVSIMPKGQVESLSLVEFSDLITYLETLRTAPGK